MKTKFLRTAIVTLITFFVASNIFAQEISLSDFTEIVVNDNINVVITQSTTQSYHIEPADVNLKVENQGGKLTISRAENKKDATIYIICSKLTAIEVLGSADVETSNEIQTDDLKISLTGSGDLDVKVKANNVNAALAGSGDIKIEGTTNKLKASVAGSGDLNAARLTAQEVKVDVAGSGDAVVHAIKNLDAGVAGSGDIRYIGQPESNTVNIVGSGSISETSQEKAEKKDIEIKSEIKIKTEGGSASSNDTTRLSFGDRKIIIIDDEDEKEKEVKKSKKESEIKHIWAGVELGFNAYSNKQFNTDLPGGGVYALDYLRSNVVNINPFERNISLCKNYVALTTGLGFQFNRFMFDNNSVLIPFKDSISSTVSAYSLTKNMLKVSYLTLPLMIQFNTSKIHKRSFHFAVGGQVALKLGSRSKQVYEVSDDKKRDIYRSSYNLNPFQYGLTARVGYGKFNVFANYNLSEMFKSGKGPELYPFQVGLTLIPW